MVRVILALLLLFINHGVMAERILLKNYIADDNNGMFQERHTVAYLWDDIRPHINAGVQLGRWRIDERSGDAEFTIAGLLAEIDMQDMGKLDLEFSPYFNSDWSSAYMNLYYRQMNYLPWYYEASYERSIVDAITAVKNHIYVDTYSVSMDIPVQQRWTGVAGVIVQSFSDANQKSGGILKLIYTFDRPQGLNTSVVFKQLNARQPGTGYFSPDSQQQLYLEARYARAIWQDNYVFRAAVSLGRETINSEIDNNLLRYEIALKGWLTQSNNLELRAGCSNAGDVLSSNEESNYRFCSVNVNLTYVF